MGALEGGRWARACGLNEVRRGELRILRCWRGKRQASARVVPCRACLVGVRVRVLGFARWWAWTRSMDGSVLGPGAGWVEPWRRYATGLGRQCMDRVDGHGHGGREHE